MIKKRLSLSLFLFFFLVISSSSSIIEIKEYLTTNNNNGQCNGRFEKGSFITPNVCVNGQIFQQQEESNDDIIVSTYSTLNCTDDTNESNNIISFDTLNQVI
ncbi:hypothetical protein DFA_12246 [Cavenderia fasciculata]|uniref:Transmembrane protein n=1 Tax=Cavenderia fasciculata TaxID=261658 RepID=F4QCV0_CACFS|nr:uncharacterized protein DFA_12246 [Cavenderia fasciculata]EGG14474.1 hypothetical protein DFA_12246 [Cavenderia fasciculata]|eukprot:XP_004353883.1 hypothetical protein DFA_12246 [Cavenderia fasciculata]